MGRRTGRDPDGGSGGPERFGFEALEAFAVAARLAEWADDCALRVRSRRPWLADQRARAGLSVMNNAAEAAGEIRPGDKARLYRYAARSAWEVAGMVVFMARRGLLAGTVEAEARATTLKAMKVLTRTARFHQSRR